MEALKKPYMAAVSGVKNSGKTTFLEKLIPELTKRGCKVAVIKHDGHTFQGDTKGTDTFRLSEAGAYGTCIFSGEKWQVVKKQPEMNEEILAQLFPEADMILLEGFKQSSYPKFEIIRKEIFPGSVCSEDTLLGIVTDGEFSVKGIPVLSFEEIEKCADILLEEVKKEKFILDV